MKKLILLGCLCGMLTSGFAQGLQIGIRGGLTNGNLSTKVPNIIEGKVRNGAVFGAFGRASLLGFFVQPEINYTSRIGEFEQVNLGKYTNTLHYVDINALMGYSLIGVLRVNAGPSMMTLLSATQEADQSMKDPTFGKEYFESTVWGFHVGAGFDLGKLCIDLRYEMNLTDMGKSAVNSTRFGNLTNYQTGFGMYSVTLGYKIFKL